MTRRDIGRLFCAVGTTYESLPRKREPDDDGIFPPWNRCFVHISTRKFVLMLWPVGFGSCRNRLMAGGELHQDNAFRIPDHSEEIGMKSINYGLNYYGPN